MDWKMQHPEISWAERTGYPSWEQGEQEEDEQWERVDEMSELHMLSPMDEEVSYALRTLYDKLVQKKNGIYLAKITTPAFCDTIRFSLGRYISACDDLLNALDSFEDFFINFEGGEKGK